MNFRRTHRTCIVVCTIHTRLDYATCNTTMHQENVFKIHWKKHSVVHPSIMTSCV